MDLCSVAEHVVLRVATPATFIMVGCCWCTGRLSHSRTPTWENLVDALCAPWFLGVSFAVHGTIDRFHELAT